MTETSPSHTQRLYGRRQSHRLLSLALDVGISHTRGIEKLILQLSVTTKTLNDSEMQLLRTVKRKLSDFPKFI